MKWNRVTYHCPTCRKTHQVSNQRRFGSGPAQNGTIAELYKDRELPAMAAAAAE